MSRSRFAKDALWAVDMSRGARILGAVSWVVIIGALFWWWSASAAEAQGKNQTLCYPPVAGSSSCQPVSPTTPYPMKAFGIANVAAPTYLEGAVSPFSFDLNGNLRVIASGSGGGAVTIADGADVTQGAVADAAATAGSTGTLSAKLRLMTTQLATLGTNTTSIGTAANQIAVQAPVAPATATATKSVLIGAQATTAAVNPTNGQQGALSSDTNNNLLTSPGGAPNLATSQVSVATSDTATVAARALRRSVTITNVTGTQQVYCSNTTATTANGQLIPAVIGASWTVSTSAAIRCIAVTGAQTVSITEIY